MKRQTGNSYRASRRVNFHNNTTQSASKLNINQFYQTFYGLHHAIKQLNSHCSCSVANFFQLYNNNIYIISHYRTLDRDDHQKSTQTFSLPNCNHLRISRKFPTIFQITVMLTNAITCSVMVGTSHITAAAWHWYRTLYSPDGTKVHTPSTTKFLGSILGMLMRLDLFWTESGEGKCSTSENRD